MILRSKDVEDAHKIYRLQNSGEECALCFKIPVINFKHWRILNNDYPYDIIAEVHHILVPVRHTTESDLSIEERDELDEIKKGYINENYDNMIEACIKNKSIPNHFHLHLILLKKHYVL